MIIIFIIRVCFDEWGSVLSFFIFFMMVDFLILNLFFSFLLCVMLMMGF